MKLVIDRRENAVIEMIASMHPSFSKESRVVIETQSGKHNVDVEIAVLTLGDILIARDDETAVLIERKSFRDFVVSIRNNRLWEQLLGMMRAEEVRGLPIKRKLLAVHGNFSDYLFHHGEEHAESVEKFWSSMMGAILTTFFVYGIPLVMMENDDAFYAFLVTELKREIDGKNDDVPESRWYRDWRKSPWELPTRDDKRILLSAIPMIGEEHARNLMEHFGTIANVANASIEELQEVPGIGEKRAKRIYDIFR